MAESEVSKTIIEWFSRTRIEEKSEWDFKKKHDYYNYIEKADLRTLRGNRVGSFEELIIANWLYENGVEYEYEPNYEHRVSTAGRREYCPDFKLTKSGVYIEHFGVRRTRNTDGTYRLTTAPIVDRERYLEEMAWKRRVHSEHGTVLIETYSYERREGRLLESLAEKIAPFETLNPRPRESLFDRVVELNQVSDSVRLLGTFLRHYKSGGHTLAGCEAKARTLEMGRRAKDFLAIFATVHAEYERRLEGRIDFEDMILRAVEYVESGRYRSPFKHIIVDEFQDISRSRGRLIQALKSRHGDARVFAVGDDWQSIYRFAGADINLMRNFGDEFGGEFGHASGVHRVVDLGRTFRSVDKIAHAARKFILKNPAQIKKTVIPASGVPHPAIKVVSSLRSDVERNLRNALAEIAARVDPKGGRTGVLLLGRYKHAAPKDLSALRREFPGLDLSFRTIHSSKGLEADHVIILEMFRGRNGFPSEVEDDSVLGLVLPDAERFESAEERRVMYVAMTRARNTLTLMGLSARQSAFVDEMVADPEYGVDPGDAERPPDGVCGECGGKLLAVPTKKERIRYLCEHWDLCGNSVSPCPECERGLPKRRRGADVAECFCGAVHRACPKCGDGWLVERSGPYGGFLGCVNYPKCDGKADSRRRAARGSRYSARTGTGPAVSKRRTG